MKIVAHRGASGQYPENTLLAFQKALEQGCDAIEFDVQLHWPHQDQTSSTAQAGYAELLVIHDPSVQIENSHPIALSELSVEQLADYNNSANNPIPTLAQALSLIDSQCTINIEVKLPDNSLAHDSAFRNRLTTTLVSCLQQLSTRDHDPNNRLLESLIISSFDHQILLEVNQLAVDKGLGKLKMAALIEQSSVDIKSLVTKLASLNLVAINPSLSCLSKSLVAAIKAQQLEVWVYTVNQTLDVNHCQALNVDAIFTDYPQQSKALLS
ncbi:glycerophosphodiester phosphodiesterase [Endozoicomonas sp. G2_1]|uniref:glycerophosphodiester phosphodiesterase n=1 Tax=Endozoicomonas sp. G2_1 TaxID=2821091 RepID=UPI001ADA5EA8|nr:glycerophosphodiester phosphodiesterase [Endozoicomonas sp. G2_1]MBO9491856.1 glycerophosphodiester phosphodiesterase [Endozoicomonas sp. G2_1]